MCCPFVRSGHSGPEHSLCRRFVNHRNLAGEAAENSEFFDQVKPIGYRRSAKMSIAAFNQPCVLLTVPPGDDTLAPNKR
jgi:hypothetical protein